MTLFFGGILCYSCKILTIKSSMKKNFLVIMFLALILLPSMANGALVSCGNDKPIVKNGVCTNCCGIGDFFGVLFNIYFYILLLSIPLTILALTIGGLFIMISAGNPNLATRGREIVKWAIIGLVLVFCSWIIINFIMTTLGYKVSWNVL